MLCLEQVLSRHEARADEDRRVARRNELAVEADVAHLHGGEGAAGDAVSI